MNSFYKEHCDRCGCSLKDGRIMSMFDTSCLCIKCKEKEKKRSNYEEAVKAEHEEIKRASTIIKGLKVNSLSAYNYLFLHILGRILFRKSEI